MQNELPCDFDEGTVADRQSAYMSVACTVVTLICAHLTLSLQEISCTKHIWRDWRPSQGMRESHLPHDVVVVWQRGQGVLHGGGCSGCLHQLQQHHLASEL